MLPVKTIKMPTTESPVVFFYLAYERWDEKRQQWRKSGGAILPSEAVAQKYAAEKLSQPAKWRNVEVCRTACAGFAF